MKFLIALAFACLAPLASAVDSSTTTRSVTIHCDEPTTFFVTFGRADIPRTLILDIFAGKDAVLLEEALTNLGGSDHVIWKKIIDTSHHVQFKAVAVPPWCFVAARVDGTFDCRSNGSGGQGGDTTTSSGGGDREYLVYVWDLDLDGDSDQTGVPERSPSEDTIEEESPGVIALPNWDDDDSDSRPDCAVPNGTIKFFDTKVNGDDDLLDMRRLVIQRIPKMPPNTRVILRFRNQADAEKVRVFNDRKRFAIGPQAYSPGINGDIIYKQYAVVSGIEASAETRDESLTYYVEGILPGESLLLDLVAQSRGASGDWSDIPDAIDTVHIMVAPFLLAPNERPAELIVTPKIAELYDSILSFGTPPHAKRDPAALATALTGLATREVHGPAVSTFQQDTIQFGYASAPGPGTTRGMQLCAKLPFDRDGLTPEPKHPRFAYMKQEENHWARRWPYAGEGQILAPNIGVFEPKDIYNSENYQSFGGNIEVSWPSPRADSQARKRPYGRLGIGVEDAAQENYIQWFEEKQDVQMVIGKPNLDWLAVKHIDEVVIALKTNDLMVPDPTLAWIELTSHWVDLRAANKNAHKPLFYQGAHSGDSMIQGVDDGTAPFVINGNEFDQIVLKVDDTLQRPGPNGLLFHYMHVYDGRAKYQTFIIVNDVQDATGRYLSILKAETLPGDLHFWGEEGETKVPRAGDKFYVVEAPLSTTLEAGPPSHGNIPYKEISANDGTRIGLPIVTTISLHNLVGTIVRPVNDKVHKFRLHQRTTTAQIQRNLADIAWGGFSDLHRIKVPVLFFNKQFKFEAVDSHTFTPNLANAHLNGSHLLMPRPYVTPVDDGQGGTEDLYITYANSRLERDYTPAYINEYYEFHIRSGEIHCSSSILRTPDLTISPAWWED